MYNNIDWKKNQYEIYFDLNGKKLLFVVFESVLVQAGLTP